MRSETKEQGGWQECFHTVRHCMNWIFPKIRFGLKEQEVLQLCCRCAQHCFGSISTPIISKTAEQQGLHLAGVLSQCPALFDLNLGREIGAEGAESGLDTSMTCV
jgi:hypothetical protein